MNKPTEVFGIPCRKFTGMEAAPACRSDCTCDGRLQPQVSVTEQILQQNVRQEHEQVHRLQARLAEVVKERDHLDTKLAVALKELSKASLSKPNNSQPDPIIPIGGGRYVDLSRVQDIEPKQQQVCLTLVSGAVAWAPVEMAGELIQAWRAIRRAQVWGRAK